MHIVKDENGNLVPHGGHDHADHHDHHHDEPASKDKTLALLTYMINHNKDHAEEINDMASQLEQKGLTDVAAQMREGVTEMQKGNMLLEVALDLYKEHQKED